jgi:hypothetical protein
MQSQSEVIDGKNPERALQQLQQFAEDVNLLEI